MISITTHVMGGIGNQLFQVFNLISYSLTQNKLFFFEERNPDRPDSPFYWDNFFKSLKPYLKAGPPMNLPLYKEEGFHFSKIIPFNKIHRPFRFYGYFQSYKYFEHRKDEIFKLIKLEEQKQLVYNKYVSDFSNSISLHFRIGDYKNLQQHHPIMSIVYYIDALKYICKNTNKNDWNIIYFYEEQDREMVTQNVAAIKCELPELTFTPVDTTIPDYEQILLMSLCQHNIIANSSFSWWGAYFNSNRYKIVTHPDLNKWFGPAQGNKKMDDLCPTEWVKVVG